LFMRGPEYHERHFEDVLVTEDESIQLDLGLAALMAESTNEPLKASLPTDSVELGSVSSQLPEEKASQSPYEILAERGDWAGLCKCAEEALGEPAASGCEAKLWWLRAQYELKAMPLSILVAPFESLLERVEGLLLDDSTASDIEPLFPYIVELLKIFQKGGLEASLGDDLKAYLVRNFSLTFEGGRDLAKSPTPLSEDPSHQRLFPEETDTKIRPSAQHSASSSDRFILLKWGGGIALCLLGVFLYWFTRSYLPSLSLSVRSPDLILASAAPLLTSPVSDRIGRVSQLDAVLYDAENSETRANSSTEEASAVDNSSRPEGQLVQPTKAPPPAVVVPPRPLKQTKGRQAEVVDTSGPVEPEGLFEERSARPSIPSNSRAGGRDPIDGRTMTVRGSQLFRVLVRTEVLAKPAFTANRIGFLQVGDEIEVERSEGPWLQVRSRMGRVGFVISQDVVPLR
jgi:hypothetical protein